MNIPTLQVPYMVPCFYCKEPFDLSDNWTSFNHSKAPDIEEYEAMCPHCGYGATYRMYGEEE